MKIRSARPEDATLLAGLNHFVHDIHAANRPDIFKKDPPAQELAYTFAKQLERESVRIFLAELPDEYAVGYATASIVRRDENALMNAESFIRLDQLAVDPKVTRRGVATALLDAVREAGRAAGCRRFVTDVWDFNNEAWAFYEASGFGQMKRQLEQDL